MPQLFPPSADMWLRLGLLGLGGGIVMLVLLCLGLARSDYLTAVGFVVAQPVPFSHEHHVNGLRIDCRYCHDAVEVSANAGFPPTETCMTCHSQVWTGAPMLEQVRDSLADDRPLHWQRVAKLPDYVYFHHDIHIHAGVGCVTCHGRVDEMPLMSRAEPFTMQFCVDCHRDPAPRLRPRTAITDMTWTPPGNEPAYGHALMAKAGIDPRGLTDCAICHR